VANIIPKGCTAVNTFTVPFTAEELRACFVTYTQGVRTVIEKDLEHCTITAGTAPGENNLAVYLSQGDTLRFEARAPIHIQIRARYKNGSVVKSEIIEATADEVLKKGEI